MPTMNFVCDHVNPPADMILQTIAIEYGLKLIRKDT